MQDKVEQQQLKRLVLDYEQREEAEELRGKPVISDVTVLPLKQMFSQSSRSSKPSRSHQDSLRWIAPLTGYYCPHPFAVSSLLRQDWHVVVCCWPRSMLSG